jgi:hypothetical protein
MIFKLTKRTGSEVKARPISGNHNAIFQVALNKVCINHKDTIIKLAQN